MLFSLPSDCEPDCRQTHVALPTSVFPVSSSGSRAGNRPSCAGLATEKDLSREKPVSLGTCWAEGLQAGAAALVFLSGV